MVAVPLIFGRLTAADYEDAVAHDPRIDLLRGRMEVKENPVFTREYYERDKRHIGNALTIVFSDGSRLQQRVDFPIGHRKRRAEGMPVLVRKFEDSVAAHFPARQAEAIRQMFSRGDFEGMAVNEFMAAMVAN
jgi:2-methylcitrate dehydratase